MKHVNINAQPRALKAFFMTEVWERFAYYGVQSLLVLYMKSVFHFSDTQAYMIFGTLGALLYITPVAGGYIADRWIGYRSAVLLGGILLAIGYFLLMINQNFFYVGLAMISVGNGFFKPNVSTMVGTLYQDNDPRRGNGFTIFYLAINIGGGLGTILCGFVQQHFGFHTSFLLVALAMAIGVVIFFLGSNFYQEIKKGNNREATLPHLCATIILAVLAIYAGTELLHHEILTNILLVIVGILITISIISVSIKSDRVTRNKLLVCFTLIIFSVIFWALYMQIPMSLTLFIDRIVDRHLLGVNVPTSAFWGLNSIALILLAGPTILLWKKLSERGINPGFANKFSMGILLMGLAFITIIIAILITPPAQHITAWWIVLSYFLLTAGEIVLSPTGLAMITVLAPAHLRGMMMGVWFYVLAAATVIGSNLAKIASVPDTMTNLPAITHIYLHAFTIFSATSILIAIILGIVSGKLNKVIRNAI